MCDVCHSSIFFPRRWLSKVLGTFIFAFILFLSHEMDNIALLLRTSDKEVDNVELQPAKRIRRAMPTIEHSRKVKTVPSTNDSPTSTQTKDCLAVTNARLKEELVVLHDLSDRKDQKYIEMLQQYFVMKTRLNENNLKMQQEAAKLRERIERMENEKNAPLVDVGTGKSNTNEARSSTNLLIHDLIIIFLVYVFFSVELDRKIVVADAKVD